ncbi:hypothetical protein ACFQRG_15100 [Scopulibacillus cellulosilyticus]|uniref:SdpC family antimicrobial peptide n=2 Tax=Scopulibacillus cellulosilyticus TaxID=2665665 RepID=A0ABW2PZY5_9BACL
MTARLKKGFLVLCGTLLLLLTVMSGITNAHAETQSKYSGEEIFKGLFFKIGPVSKMVPDTLRPTNQTKVNKDDLQKEADKISDQIKKEHPDYYNKLESAVYKKDYKQTYDLINEGGQYIVDYLKENYGSDLQSMSKKTNAAHPNCAAWVYVEVVAVVSAAAIVFPAVVAYIQYPDNASTLDKQKAVKQLIVNVNQN